MFKTMLFSVEGSEYAVLRVRLEDETLFAQTGSLVLIDASLRVEVTSYENLLKRALRKLFTGESLFLLKVSGRGEVWLAPPLPGSVEALELRDDCFVLQDHAYLAHFGDLTFSVEHKGLKSLLGTELVWLKVCGRGTLWVSGYGHLFWTRVGPDRLLDPLHFVAFRLAPYELEGPTEGLKNGLFDGELDFIRFREPTEVLVQSRIVPPLAKVVSRFTPQKAVKSFLLKRRPL
ncbi:MAG: AIM24 family protein [Aquificae bacterium]|nr:AIM24 family protein [Aquificota bacterium]